MSSTPGNLSLVGSSEPDIINRINALTGVQSVAYAAAITPDVTSGRTVIVGTLTGDITVNNPPATNEVAGQELELVLTQDGAGSHVLTLGSKFKNSAAITATASKKSILTFQFDGTNWNLVASALNL